MRNFKLATNLGEPMHKVIYNVVQEKAVPEVSSLKKITHNVLVSVFANLQSLVVWLL